MKARLNHVKFLTRTLLILQVMSMLNIQAQDILISFAGVGESSTVDSVKVENLTQGTKLKMKGSDVLRLMGITGIETISDNESSKIVFYPNPMKEYSRMQFVLPEQGETMIILYDLSGRELAQTLDLLLKGQHTYAIKGVEEGVYFVTVNSGRYSLSGKLISSGSKSTSAIIEHESSSISQEKQSDSKGTNAENVMQYNTGDRLKLTGISGIYSTIVTDIPAASKTVTYNFIPCTDGDGNNYPVVQIGTAKGTTDNPDPSADKGLQTWMAKNLMTTKLKDGTVIPNVTVGSEWYYLKSPGCCWFNNDASTYKYVYGTLYNWYTVNTGNLCPTGWHVPGDDEWKTLITYLGGEDFAGGKLKETGLEHWTFPNSGATNETCFTALGGGYRASNGIFYSFKLDGIWWSATEFNNSTAYKLSVRHLDIDSSGGAIGKYCGLSVRCLKDQ